jgi:hypothetical protein
MPPAIGRFMVAVLAGEPGPDMITGVRVEPLLYGTGGDAKRCMPCSHFNGLEIEVVDCIFVD